jgi:hypothetical protein|tara:strand:+ start:257 stop:436 length:180 start_codon:yes stop_codon:yes gene_type:complete
LTKKEKTQSSSIEIVLVNRDNNGKPTGKKQKFSSSRASEISEFFNNKKPRKRNKKSKRK